MFTKQILYTENRVAALLTANDARYDTRVFLNMTDTHNIITNKLDYNVITTLCSIGSEVTIYSQHETICSTNNMTGVSFACQSTCSGSQYIMS